jgi:GNAT superfamily N-acetyltransferase
MSESIRVTRCTAEDLAEVTDLFDSYRTFYGQPSQRECCSRFLSERISQQESVIFLAYRDSKTVGFVQLYPSFSSLAMNRIWILNDLFVVDSARKNGVGTALLQAAENFARESNAVRLTLTTGVENLTAQSLYESLGWQRDEAYFQYLKPVDPSVAEKSEDV